jgi:phage gpG-like protein
MVELSINVDSAVKYFEQIAGNLEGGFRAGFERIAIQILATVQRKLSGEVLNIRSGKLFRSATSRVEETGDSISAIVEAGALAPYGRVHEYGWSGTIPEHMSASRLGKAFLVKAHEAKFPERSFMRTSLQENEAAILQILNDLVTKAVA